MIRQVGFFVLLALLFCVEYSDATTAQVLDAYTNTAGRVSLSIYYGDYPTPAPYSWFAPYDGPFTQVEKIQILDTNIFSGARDFVIGFMSNTFNQYDLIPDMRATVSGVDPRVQISIPFGFSGTYYTQYDGNDAGAGEEYFANGAITSKSDFTSLGGAGVSIEVKGDDFVDASDRTTNRVYYTLSVKDTNNERADVELDTTLMSSIYRKYAFLFDEFTTTTAGTFDWTKVTALQIRVSTYPFSDGFDPDNPPARFVSDPPDDEYVTNFRRLQVFSLSISGSVGRNCGCDETFDAYSGETITLTNNDNGDVFTTLTSATGGYLFSMLESGAYTVCWTDSETPLCGTSCVNLDVDSSNIDPVVNFYSLINILTVPGDTTTECDNTDPATTGAATVSSCSGSSTVTYSDSPTTNADGCVTSIERTWSETEQGISGIQTITIEDTTNPDFDTDPTDRTVECGPGVQDDFDSWKGSFTASDNCDTSVSITVTPDDANIPSSCFVSTSVVFIATDNCGNTNTQTVDYTVEDTVAPSFDTVPTAATIPCGPTEADDFSAWLATAAASDVCTSATITDDSTGPPTVYCGAGSTVTVIFTATDACGTAATATSTFTIEDTVDPFFTTDPSSDSYECDGTTTTTAAFNAWVTSNAGAAGDDACGTATLSNSGPTIPDFCGGTATMTVTLSDACANTAVATVTYTIDDTTPPTISGATDASFECTGSDTDLSTDFAAWVSANAGATGGDACGFDELTNNNPAAPTNYCGAGSSVTMTITAHDNCGNTQTATASYTAIDSTGPSFTTDPSDVTYECDGSTSTNAAFGSWVTAHGGAVATDPCGTVTLTNNGPSIPNFCGGTTTLTVTATDSCGNPSTASATYTIDDTVPPTLTGATDASFECTGNDADMTSDFADWKADFAGATGGDACGFDELTTSATSAPTAYCGAGSSVTMTITAHDNCGNTQTATASYTAKDTTDPFFTTGPIDATHECDGTSTDFDAWVTANGGAVVGDTCGTTTVSNNDPDTPNFCDGTATLTVIVSDACANTATATATYTIEDTTPPTISGETDATFECTGDDADLDAAFATWTSSFAGAGATDACGTTTLGHNNPTAPTAYCNSGSSVTMTITATDSCGETATATASFTAKDTTDPIFDVLPAATTVDCGPGEAAAYTAWLASASATDSCSGAATITNDSTGPPTADCNADGTVTVTFTATDACGNDSVGTSTFTVQDNGDPVFDTPPSSFTFECDGTSTDFDAWKASHAGAAGSDSCGPTTITSTNPSTPDFCGGTATMTVTLTDACGNTNIATVTYTIDDTVPPTLTGATDASFECTGNDADMTSDFADWKADFAGATGGDACGFDELTTSATSAPTAYCGAGSSVIMTITAHDNCGNTQTATASYTAKDTTDPFFTTGPIDATHECDGTSTDFDAWVTANGGAVVGDTCGTTTVSNNDPDTPSFCDGTATLTVIVSDACANTATATATYTIEDTTPPTISGETDATFECTGDDADLDAAFATWTSSFAGAGATDACGTTTLGHNNPTAPTAYCNSGSSVTMTITATDSCGETATATASFTAKDTTDPIFDVLPAATTVDCGPGEAAAYTAWLASASATDSCSGAATITNDSTGPPTADCNADGTVTVTFTATDACGNDSVGTSTFTVQDNGDPVFDTPPSSFTFECDGTSTDFDAWKASHAGAAGSDSCGPTTITSTNPSTPDFCGGTATMTVTLTDACGNTNIATVTYTIDDTVPPTLTGATDASFECTGNDADMTSDFADWKADFAGATGGDACGFDELTTSATSAPTAYCGAGSSVIMTITAHDNCGNTQTATASYTAKDTTDPFFTTGPIDATHECDGTSTDFDAWVTANGGAVVGDTCGTTTVSNNDPDTPNFCDGTATLTVIVSDACANTATATATYTIEDTTPPTISGETDATFECTGNDADLDAAFATWTSSFAGAGATDACGTTTLGHNNPTAPTAYCGAGSSVTMTITATDSCGETATATASFTAKDTTDPSFTTSPSDYTSECSSSTSTEFDDWLASNAGAVASDTCDGVLTLTNDNSGPSISQSCSNSRVVNFTGTDVCGNSVSGTAQFAVTDTTNPVITTQASDRTVQCNAATNGDAFTLFKDEHGGASGFDACTTTSWTASAGTPPYTGTITCNAEHEVTFTLSDTCGHSSTTTASFFIEDTLGPSITSVATDLQVECHDPTHEDTIQDWLDANGNAAATDCQTSALTWTNDYTATGVCPFDDAVTFTVCDECSNCAQTSANLNKIPPIIYEPDDISEWAIYHPACIAWSVARVHGDVGTLTLEYGIGFANAIELETGYDLTLGTYEWIVHGMYPAIARVKISYEDIVHDPIYSHEFEVRSVQTRLDNSCALVL